MVTKQVSKREQRAVEKRLLVDRVEAAIVEARSAAQNAHETYTATVERDPARHAWQSDGIAWVWVYKPSYPFRVALIEAGVIHESNAGEWRIRCANWGVARIGRLDEQEVVCDAVRLVLKRHFPNEFFGYSTKLN